MRPASSAAPSSAAREGSASARSPRLAASLRLGRRRLLDLVTREEEMRETKEECLMRRLSRLLERKESGMEASGRMVLGGGGGGFGR